MSNLDLTTWPLEQLQRMARYNPERLNGILGRVLQTEPELFHELVIGAADQEMISISEAAELTGLEHYEVERRIFEFRQSVAFQEVAIERESKGVARLSHQNVAVWEIVREFRKVGSVDGLKGSFPDLSKKELAVALRYAEANPEEIQSNIDSYEAMVLRRKSEYPFAD